MNKEMAREHIEKNLTQGDSLVGFFFAQQQFKSWLYLFIGPLAILSMKSYFVAITTKGVHFHRLSLSGKFSDNDFFEFAEIANVKIGKGILRRPMRFQFRNGRHIKINPIDAMLQPVVTTSPGGFPFLLQHRAGAGAWC